MAASAQLLQDSLLVIWNDRDAARRLASMQGVYAPTIQFFERDGSVPIVGHEALNALISQLQTDWPASFVFALSGPVRVNHQVQHAAWTLGEPGGPAVANGLDIAVVEDDLIKFLYLFLDSTSAEAA